MNRTDAERITELVGTSGGMLLVGECLAYTDMECRHRAEIGDRVAVLLNVHRDVVAAARSMSQRPIWRGDSVEFDCDEPVTFFDIQQTERPLARAIRETNHD